MYILNKATLTENNFCLLENNFQKPYEIQHKVQTQGEHMRTIEALQAFVINKLLPPSRCLSRNALALHSTP